MLAYATDWYGSKTFRLMPLTNDCPFNEAIYDPNTKVLAIIGKTQVEKPVMLPKLNDKGETILVKGSNPAQPRYVEERRILNTFTEYYMDVAEDVMDFVTRHVVNPEHPSIIAAMTVTAEQEPEQSK